MADDLLRMISMELAKLGHVALLDARTLKPLDVFDMFFGKYVRPVGSKPASVLALLEGVFTPIFITPVVWADGRPDEGHDFPLVYHLRDLAARLDGGPSLVSTALS